MASKRSVVESYRRRWTVPAADPEWTLRNRRVLTDERDVPTTEPGKVDCLEVNAAGAPGLLARAMDAAADRRLRFIHGGGYVAGAIDTHHKMYTSLAKAVGARALLMAGRAPEADDAIAGLTGWPNLAA